MKGRKMLQVVLLLVLTLALTVSISYADAPQVSIAAVQVDGEKVAFNPGEEPVFINERIYVTLRTVGDALGAECSWDGENRVVTLVRNDKAIMLPVDAGMYYVDGAGYAYDQDMAPLMMNGRTWVPLRMVSESFGVKISWDGKTNTVKIDSTQGSKQVVASVDTPVLAAASTQEGICDEFKYILENVPYTEIDIAGNLVYYGKQGKRVKYDPGKFGITKSGNNFDIIQKEWDSDTYSTLEKAVAYLMSKESAAIIVNEIRKLPDYGQSTLTLEGKKVSFKGYGGYVETIIYS